MCLPSLSTVPRMVSRYATCGLPTLASTLNSRRMRSTMISRCSSPMPLMMVCADSSSVDTRNDGSSFARRCSARLIFSWSACVFGSTATEMTGTGMFIFSSVMTFSRSQIVSPVYTSLRPTAAAMSPACTSLISLRSLACICSRRPMRSFFDLGRHEHRVAGIQRAGVHAEEREVADEGIVEDLERQRRERLVVGARCA